MSGDQALRAGQIIRRLREFVARGDSERRIESVKFGFLSSVSPEELANFVAALHEGLRETGATLRSNTALLAVTTIGCGNLRPILCAVG